MSRARWRARLAPAAGAVICAGAFALVARVEWPWVLLGWVALAPWLAALDGVRTTRGAVLAGLLMSEAFVLFLFPWFPASIAAYADAPLPWTAIALPVLAPILEPQFVVFAVVRGVARRRARSAGARILPGAAAWVAAEWALPKLFADTLGHGLFASPLWRQGADLAGAHGLTFVLLVVNECLLDGARAVLRSREPAALRGVRRTTGVADAAAPADRAAAIRRAAWSFGIAGALVASLAGYGAMRLAALRATDAAPALASVAVVQPGIAGYARLAAELGTFGAVRRILDTCFALSDEALARPPVDLVVWPETVYPTTFGAPKSEAGAEFDREIEAFVAGAGIPLVLGSYARRGSVEHNAAFVLEPGPGGTQVSGTYLKGRLFPLTETVPGWLDRPAVRRALPWLGTWQPGPGPAVLAVRLSDGRMIRVAPLICYDAVDPEYVARAVDAGADLIVTLSNDSWFPPEAARLHLVLAAFRSIETRRPQVRATNTGVSAVIDASGDLLATLALDERGAVVRAVPRGPGGGTPYLRFGRWLGRAALTAVVVWAAWVAWTDRTGRDRRAAAGRPDAPRG